MSIIHTTAAAAEQVALVDFKYPAITTTPSPSNYHKATGLVHGVMKRETSRLGITTKVHFAFQNAAGAEMAVLFAEKDGPNAYSIYDNDSNNKLGSLHRIQSGISSVSYALFKDGVQVATILYVVPSVAEVFRDAPPRRAQVAFAPKTLVDMNDYPNWFAAACKDCIRKNSNLDGLADAGCTVFESKMPYVKSSGRVGLNFHGRGREASPKNMQLVVLDGGADANNKTTCQMAKWEQNVYNVDFGAPFTTFHAFGFGLAQLDL